MNQNYTNSKKSYSTKRNNGSGAYRPSKKLKIKRVELMAIVLTTSTFLLWYSNLVWFGIFHMILISTLTFCSIVFIAYERYIIARVMTAPLSDDDMLRNAKWETFHYTGWGEDTLPAHFLPANGKSKDLMIFLHGWSSSPSRIEPRMMHVHSLGMNILTTDLRGHSMSSHLKSDWTFLKMLTDVECLLDTFETTANKLEIERVFIYGHSMGGFLTLRLTSHSGGWWKKSLNSIILESPMTSFPLIMNSSHKGPLRFLLPITRLILRHEYLRIHPDLSLRYAESEVPMWGIPQIPILVLQSEEDIRLGQKHYSLLKTNLPEDAETHVISSLQHTSGTDSEDRKKLLSNYLNSNYGIAVSE